MFDEELRAICQKLKPLVGVRADALWIAYPLSLSRLMKLCNRSGTAVRSALRYLANTIPLGSHDGTLVYYDRIQSLKNKSHRPYRIFLRTKSD